MYDPVTFRREKEALEEASQTQHGVGCQSDTWLLWTTTIGWWEWWDSWDSQTGHYTSRTPLNCSTLKCESRRYLRVSQEHDEDLKHFNWKTLLCFAGATQIYIHFYELINYILVLNNPLNLVSVCNVVARTVVCIYAEKTSTCAFEYVFLICEDDVFKIKKGL